jgi:hypothetical protein
MRKRKRTSDTELKEILRVAVLAADARYQKGHFKCPSKGAENAPFGVLKASFFVYNSVHRKMRKRHAWRQVQALFARAGIERMRLCIVRGREFSSEDPAQLSLPGFEFLPKRVRLNRQSLAFGKITLTQFLGYKQWYESHLETDQRVVADLRSLAEKVQPFAEKEPDLILAEALRRTIQTEAPARLAVVSSAPR